MAQRDPLISVLMPVYNAESYLAEALGSLWLQTLRDFEVIAVDDGSTDGSPQILAHAARTDKRLRIIRTDHRGATAALSTGLTEIRGRYIARMDADDICEPTRFESQATWLEARPEVAAVGSALTLIDEEGWTICSTPYPCNHETILERMLDGRNGLAHPAVMMRTEKIQQIGGYDPSYATAQDFDLWLRLSETGKLSNIEQALLRYRVHPRSVGSQKRESQRSAVIRALMMYGERTGRRITPPRLPRREMTTALQQRVAWARWAWRSGQTATARKHAWAVLRRRPWHLEVWSILWRL